MKTADMLFGSRAKSALLSTMYNKPGESFHVRELVRSIGMGSGVIQRELESLTKLKLILMERKGNRCFYHANMENSLFPDLQSIMLKTSLETVPDVMKKALRTLRPKIRTAFVFGSVARNQAKPGSDIDVLIVGDATFEDVAPRFAKAEAKLHREINPTIYSEPQFRTRLLDGNHFLSTVLDGDKLFLIGDAGDVQRLGHVQKAH
jgi:predicted nucleotidyltransferase